MTLIPSQQSRMELWLRQSKGRGQRERWIFWQKQSDEPAMQREARKANAWKSSLPASPVHTQLPAAPLILPREGLPTAWHPQGRTGAGEAQSLHGRAEWALLSTGLSLSLCSPTEPRVPLTSVLSLEHGERPPAVGHPWRHCPRGPSHLLAKRSPYCRFLSANPRAEFPQTQRKTLYLQGSHRPGFHLQMGESLPGYRKFWGQHS